MPRTSSVPRRTVGSVLLACLAVLPPSTVDSQVRERQPTVRAAPDVWLARPHRAITPYRINTTVSAKPVLVVPASHAVDLRPQISSLGIAIRDQGSRGTCSVHAVAFLLEFGYAKQSNLPLRNLSEEYLNRAANIAGKNSGDGDYFSNIDLGFQQLGVVTERDLPYAKTFDQSATLSATLMSKGQQRPRLTPDWIKPWDSSSGASARQVEAVVNSLRAGIPVAVGMWWPKQGAFATDVIGGVPVMRDVGKAQMFDGHSVALVGFVVHASYPGGGYFILRNSWGDGWDAGYGYVSFDYIGKYANDLLAYL